MSEATLMWRPHDTVHRLVVTDAELEAAAEESALSYTYQTDAYYPCCI